MQMQKLTQYTAMKNARRAHPVWFDRVAAGLAVIAWLALAGDAFAQGANTSANQWAPTPQGQPAAIQPAQSTQVWSNGAASTANTFAPADLDQRLTGATLAPAPMPTPVLAPAPAPAATAPIYAPVQLANPAAAQPVAPQYAAPQGAPIQPGYANAFGPQSGGQPYGAPGYGYGAPMQPYGNGFGAMPFPGGAGVPGGYPYGNGFNNGFGPGFSPGFGGPGYGGYNIPSSNVWGGNNSNYSNGGIPFFGGSPFGFW